MASRYYDERNERWTGLDAQAGDEDEPLAESANDDQDTLSAPTGQDDRDSAASEAQTQQGAAWRRTSRKGTRRARTGDDGIIHLSEPEAEPECEAGAETESQDDLVELEAKGFTADEAIRLIHVSQRAATSREARDAEATLRRLRFTRWLIDHGMLDEFSA